MTRRTILILEADAAVAAELRERVTRLGYAVCGALTCGAQAIERTAALRPDLVLVDATLPGPVDGAEAAAVIGRRYALPVIFLVDGAEELPARAWDAAPYGCALKSGDGRQLRLTIDSALNLHAAHARSADHLIHTVFNSISDGVVATDMEGKFLFVNDSAMAIVGMGAQEGPTDEWAETYGTFHPDRQTPFPSEDLPLVRAMRGERTEEVELFIRNRQRPDGVFISVIGRPLQDPDRGHVGGVIVLRDVTRHKDMEARLQRTMHDLQRQNELMETVFDSISDGVVAADETGAITILNPSAERISGLDRVDGALGRPSEDYGIYYPDRVTLVPADEMPLTRALRGEESDDVDLYVRNRRVPDGVYVRVSGRPLRDPSGGRRGGVIAFRDVTARMRAEVALQEAFADGRLEVVDTVLHNIGNAINSVAVGVETNRERARDRTLLRRLSGLAEAAEAHRDDWLDYLRHDPQGRQVRPFIVALAADFKLDRAAWERTIDRVADRVAHIVDIVRTQRGLERRPAVRKHVGLRASIDAAVRLVYDSLAVRDIAVSVDCPAEPQTIHVDESRFQQMLVNLIRNAMDAIDALARAEGRREEPRIRIRSYRQDGFLVIDVIDNGIGIDRKDFTAIFAAGHTTKEEGSGLGLHSAANFVIGSGGRIQPLSDGIGHGTTMRVMLRLSAVAPVADGR